MRVFFHFLRHSAWLSVQVIFFFLCGPTLSQAGVKLEATRLIVSDGLVKGATIGVRSEASSQRPFLVKAQVFGDVEGRQTQVPFTVTPPVFRLEPGNAQQLRVMSKGEKLPQDKESIFYLSVSALPALAPGEQAEDAGLKGRLNVATGNIIKLFYRPSGLPMTQQEAMSKLQFSASGGGVNVTNPTPYYITLGSLRVNGQSINIRTVREQNMLAPFTRATFAHSPQSGPVQWQAINDYGGWEAFNGSLR